MKYKILAAFNILAGLLLLLITMITTVWSIQSIPYVQSHYPIIINSIWWIYTSLAIIISILVNLIFGLINIFLGILILPKRSKFSNLPLITTLSIISLVVFFFVIIFIAIIIYALQQPTCSFPESILC